MFLVLQPQPDLKTLADLPRQVLLLGSIQYAILALTVHIGGAESGHCVAITRQGDNNFLLRDDDKVHQSMSWQSVLAWFEEDRNRVANVAVAACLKPQCVQVLQRFWGGVASERIQAEYPHLGSLALCYQGAKRCWIPKASGSEPR